MSATSRTRGAAASAVEEDERAPGSWSIRKSVILFCSIAGLGVATYLTIAHYDSSVVLACSDTGIVNCLKVTTSPQSVIFGIPVAVLGLGYFVVMTAFSLPLAWRSAWRPVAMARLALAVSGIGFVFYLVYNELFVIHAICLWCTSVHVLTFVLFVTNVTGWDEATEPWWAEDDAA